MAWAVARFWKRRAAPLVPSRSTSHMRRSAGRGAGCRTAGATLLRRLASSWPAALKSAQLHKEPCCRAQATGAVPVPRPSCSRSSVLPDDLLPSSRYETDFTELRALGRGGYGVVVSGRWGPMQAGWCVCVWWVGGWGQGDEGVGGGEGDRGGCCSRCGGLHECAKPSASKLSFQKAQSHCAAQGARNPAHLPAAINKMDGRQYAVKKIPLDAHSAGAWLQDCLAPLQKATWLFACTCRPFIWVLPITAPPTSTRPVHQRAGHSGLAHRPSALRPAGAYARIMREVTTLSRLQHINVVRYFQVADRPPPARALSPEAPCM